MRIEELKAAHARVAKRVLAKRGGVDYRHLSISECPECGREWEAHSRDMYVTCPDCQRKLAGVGISMGDVLGRWAEALARLPQPFTVQQARKAFDYHTAEVTAKRLGRLVEAGRVEVVSRRPMMWRVRV
jgi:hypothetical protein